MTAISLDKKLDKNNLDRKKIKEKTVLFSGGGTAGSITPLLVVIEKLFQENRERSDQRKLNLVFLGTKQGPEEKMITSFNKDEEILKFISINSGKWRRYFSWKNFTDILKTLGAFFKSFSLLKREKVDLVLSAGSFVSVPLVLAAAFKNIPILIHQEDIRPGLANRLMAPFARTITVTFSKSLNDYGSKAVWIGNPVKKIENSLEKKIEIKNKYGLDLERPLILVSGGGTGSQAINDLIIKTKDKLIQEGYQIVHLSGQGKLNLNLSPSNFYHPLELVSHQESLELISIADLVISRCGLATLSELAAYSKLAVLIPIPDSHQEDNARVFTKAEAALVLNQKDLNSEKFLEALQKLLNDLELRKKFKNNIGKIIKKGATESFLSIIEEILSAS